MREAHHEIVKRIKKRHLKVHLAGTVLLVLSVLVNVDFRMETNLVRESYRLFKGQFNSMVFKHQLYSLLRGKALTINQAMDVAEVMLDQNRVPASMALAMISVESNFDPNATSKSGAKGLTQIMPIIQKEYADHPSFKRELKEVHDISTNVKLGLHYLGDLQDKFGDWTKSLRAYNAGPENANNQKYDEYAKIVLNKAKEFHARLEM